MPATRVQSKSIFLIGGDDEFSVKAAAAKLAEKLAPKGAGEFGIEIIDGAANNQDEVLKVLGRLYEALNTVGFFGAQKLVWFKSTNLLAGDETAVRAEAVNDALAELGDTLKRGVPDGVRLLISAIGLDKRRTVYKVLEKVAEVQLFDAPEASRQAGEEEISEFVQKTLRAEGKKLSGAGYKAFREVVAPDLREMANELEKLCLYVGKRAEITEADVRAICSASRQAVIWELTDALGARQAVRAVAALENLLGAGEQPIGVLMMLVGQFRLMLLMKDLMARKVIGVSDGSGANFQFVKAFEQLPESQIAHFPKTKEGGLPSPWRLYRCALAARNFSIEELIGAMDLLLEANRQLVSTQLDARLVLEEAIAKIARKRAVASV
jgi:DNA polymerase III subunit delta